jgi:hypothetical protein
MSDQKRITRDRSMITFHCKVEPSPWAISHFIAVTSSVYLKMASIHIMADILQGTGRIAQFALYTESMELFPELGQPEFNMLESDSSPNKADENTFSGQYVPYGKAASSEVTFWSKFKRLERPSVVWRSARGDLVPLYETSERYDFKLRKIISNSPASISFEGFGQSINDLRFGARREHRDSIEFQNNQVGTVAENLIRPTHLSRLLEAPGVPEGFRSYAKTMYAQLLDKQRDICGKIGVDDIQVDMIA